MRVSDSVLYVLIGGTRAMHAMLLGFFERED